MARAALCLAGLIVMAGAAAAWHFWQMNGLVAFIIAGVGIDLIWESTKEKKGKK